jgi:hypothetical protein
MNKFILLENKTQAEFFNKSLFWEDSGISEFWSCKSKSFESSIDYERLFVSGEMLRILIESSDENYEGIEFLFTEVDFFSLSYSSPIDFKFKYENHWKYLYWSGNKDYDEDIRCRKIFVRIIDKINSEKLYFGDPEILEFQSRDEWHEDWPGHLLKYIKPKLRGKPIPGVYKTH